MRHGGSRRTTDLTPIFFCVSSPESLARNGNAAAVELTFGSCLFLVVRYLQLSPSDTIRKAWLPCVPGCRRHLTNRNRNPAAKQTASTTGETENRPERETSRRRHKNRHESATKHQHKHQDRHQHRRPRQTITRSAGRPYHTLSLSHAHTCTPVSEQQRQHRILHPERMRAWLPPQVPGHRSQQAFVWGHLHTHQAVDRQKKRIEVPSSTEQARQR